jgi:hypothetical protein
MNIFGFTTWKAKDGLRTWKWLGRDDVYVVTEDMAVLAVISIALADHEGVDEPDGQSPQRG